MGKSFFPPLEEILSSFAADGSKVGLERPYDAVAKTKVAEYLKTLPENKKFATAMLIFFLNATGKWHIGSNTSLRDFMRDVLGDAAPEFVSRLYRGGSRGRMTLMALDADLRQSIFNWLGQLTPEQRGQFRAALVDMTSAELTKFAELAESDRSMFLEL